MIQKTCPKSQNCQFQVKLDTQPNSSNYSKKADLFNSLSANPTKWSNTLKLFDHFVGLALKGLIHEFILGAMTPCSLASTPVYSKYYYYFNVYLRKFQIVDLFQYIPQSLFIQLDSSFNRLGYPICEKGTCTSILRFLILFSGDTSSDLT